MLTAIAIENFNAIRDRVASISHRGERRERRRK
jgi:hypothetical protein